MTMTRGLLISVGQHSDKGRKPVNQDFHGVLIPEEPLLSLKGIAAVLADGMRTWRGYLEKLVIEGQKKKVIRRDLDPAVAATMMQDLWMGASQRSQVERSVAPLRAAALFLRNYLTPS